MNPSPWEVFTMKSTGGLRYVVKRYWHGDRPASSHMDIARDSDNAIYAYRTREEAQNHADRLNEGR